MLDFATKVMMARGTCLFSTGQAGFIVKSKSGQLLGIDLYLSNCVERLEGHQGFKRLLPQILEPSDLCFDIIICTHPHLDHFDVDAVPEMLSKGAKLFCSTGCKELIEKLNLNYYEKNIAYVVPRDEFNLGDFYLKFVNCDHGAAAPDAVGVIIQVDGKKIYEVGDSCLRLDNFDETFKSLDILITPINGMYGNMNAEEATILAETLKPAITIPCHYGMFASHGGNLHTFHNTMSNKKLPFLLMQQGEQYKIESGEF